MAKDPAFLFYPGDYLRDTQCLSESVQVAYDRIMCEHMRNICITQQQLNFFTKKLSPDEKEELLMVLTPISGGFQITWVAESISKRKAYSQSRRENRSKRTEKDMSNISETYVQHMENENENENESTIVLKKVASKKFKIPTLQEIAEYCLERKNSVNATRFFNFYESKDWMIGKNKMKDWKAAVRTWEENQKPEEEKPALGRMTATTANNSLAGFIK